MELNIYTSSLATVTSQFPHLSLKTCHKLTAQYNKSCLLKLKPFSASHPPLKSTLLQQPEYEPTIIPPLVEPDRISIGTNDNNTIMDVLRLFDGLQVVVTPDVYASLVAECTRKRDAAAALELYAHMKGNYRMVKYLKGSNGLPLINRILMMFVICGCLDVALQLFDEMPLRNSVSLAILVAGLVNNELLEQGLCLFVDMYECFMQRESHTALQVVVACVFKAGLCFKDVHLGKGVHGWLIKMGYGRKQFVGTALVEFYGRCRCLSEANRVFFEQVQMDGQCDTALWTSAIINNCRTRSSEDLIRVLREMGRVGVTLNEYMVSSLLKACGRILDDLSFGQQIHGNAVKLGFVNHDFVVCSLVDMYGRRGLLSDARKIFDSIEIQKRSNVCWNAMATGFIQHGMWIEALNMMYRMKAAGLQPQQSMLDEVRMACGSMNLTANSSRSNIYHHDYIEPG